MRNTDSTDIAVVAFISYWVIVLLSPIEVALDTLVFSFVVAYVGYILHFYHRD